MADTIVKRIGGKIYLRKWISSYLPPHTVYCEPFGGSFAVGLSVNAKRLVYNDLDQHVYNLFKTIRDHKDKFIEKVKYTPYSRQEFEYACDVLNDKSKPWLKLDKIEWARLYLIFNRQSFAGKEDGTWAIAKQSENFPDTWDSLPKLIDTVSDKLKDAFIENSDYKDIFKRWDAPYTTFYIDPPYEKVEDDYYHVNKKDGFDHVALAEAVHKLKGSAVISYYESDYIKKLYPGFDIQKKDVIKHMQTKETKDKATEMLLIKKSTWADDNSDEEDLWKANSK